MASFSATMVRWLVVRCRRLRFKLTTKAARDPGPVPGLEGGLDTCLHARSILIPTIDDLTVRMQPYGLPQPMRPNVGGQVIQISRLHQEKEVHQSHEVPNVLHRKTCGN